MKRAFGALALSVAISQALAAEVAVRLPAGAQASPPESAEDYGSFQWLWVNAEQAAELARVPGAQLLPDARLVQLGPHRFDPVEARGEPLLDADGYGLHVVQFDAPLRAEWTRDLAAAGIKVLQYLPHNAVLVWASPAQLVAGRSATVRGIAPVLAEYKRDATLEYAAPVSASGIKVFYYAGGDGTAGADALTAAGGIVLDNAPAQPDRTLWIATLELPAARLDEVLALPFVINVGFEAERQLDDEQANQILGPNFATPTTLQLGYANFLGSVLGVTGQGVIWSVVDSGTDASHPDIAPAWAGGVTQGCTLGNDGQGDDATGGGHGTHVGGAIVGRGLGDGTGPAAETDANGFRYGQGVAPGARIWSARLVCSGNTLTDVSVTRLAVEAGASGSNNSWNNGAARSGYTASARSYDVLVRDGNFNTTAQTEAFAVFFSAGNAGAAGLTAPHEAKNIVSVANTGTPRSTTGPALVSSSSSRGPAVDGRILPVLSAPGAQTAAPRNAAGGSCATAIAGTENLYALCSGTSMSAPRASGTAALVIEWYRNRFGTTPSPAMIKAMLVNGARDLPGSQPGGTLTDGSRPIPNNDEGWGIIDLRSTLGPDVRGVYRDQVVVLTQTGESRTLTVQAVDPSQPLKVTLAWTDAPGAVGANPALVNNLDLVVEQNGNSYRGNVFQNGTSTTGGSADTLANLENVYIANPGTGLATIRVIGTAINADALSGNGTPTTPKQDYALVCTNCIAELFRDGFE
jgi:subtilisin family serine protease